MIYTITLNPALDYYMQTNTKSFQKLTRVKTAKLLPGGKGINASILLNNLGVKNIALILTGQATGDMLRNLLNDLKVNYQNFDIRNSTRINAKITMDNTYEFNAPGINKNPNISQEIYQYLEQSLTKNDVIMIMGSVMAGLEKDIVKNISDIAVRKESKLVYDLSDAKILNYLQYKPLAIKPNFAELESYFQTKITNFQQLKIKAQALINMGAQNVIVSQDKKGAYLFTEKMIVKTNPLSINLINASGAGDAMLAGFIYKLLATKDEVKAINFANASGAGTAATQSIAQADVINALYKKVTYKKIGG